jgi:hypothetical protein
MAEKRHPLRRAEKLLATAGKYLGLFGTAMKLTQLLPAAVGLAIVFFSPSAWLSSTLRHWAMAGVAVGSVLGMVAFAVLGPHGKDQERVGAGALLVAAASAAILRFHLALVDLAFVESWTWLQPLHDAYLGSDLGELAYNALTALWFGAALLFSTFGLPLFLRGRAERRAAEATTPTEPRTASLTSTLAALSDGIAALERDNAELRDANRRLRRSLEEQRGTIERLQETGRGPAPGPAPGPGVTP